MAGRWELTDEQWLLVEPVLRGARRANNRGRPWYDTRAVLNGALRVLGTGAQWRELPERYPPFQTCHRRFQQCVRSGKLEEALRLLARQLLSRATPPALHRRRGPWSTSFLLGKPRRKVSSSMSCRPLRLNCLAGSGRWNAWSKSIRSSSVRFMIRGRRPITHRFTRPACNPHLTGCRSYSRASRKICYSQ